MRTVLVVFLLIALTHFSYAQLAENKKLVVYGSLNDAYIYSCEEVGWKIKVIQDWRFLSQDEKKAMNERGEKMIEKAYDEEVQIEGLKDLLNIRKDDFNSFLSTIEPYNPAISGSYEDHNKNVLDVLINTFENQGIKTTHKTNKEKINGLLFSTIEFDILHPQDEKNIILSMKLYSRYINGYDFGMTITFNNAGDKKRLVEMVESSVFTMRK